MPCELQYREQPAAIDACDDEGHIEVWSSSGPQNKGMQFVSSVQLSLHSFEVNCARPLGLKNACHCAKNKVWEPTAYSLLSPIAASYVTISSGSLACGLGSGDGVSFLCSAYIPVYACLDTMWTYMRGDTGKVGAAYLTKAGQQLLMGHVTHVWTLSVNRMASKMLLDILLQVFNLARSDLKLPLAVIEYSKSRSDGYQQQYTNTEDCQHVFFGSVKIGLVSHICMMPYGWPPPCGRAALLAMAMLTSPCLRYRIVYNNSPYFYPFPSIFGS